MRPSKHTVAFFSGLVLTLALIVALGMSGCATPPKSSPDDPLIFQPVHPQFPTP